MKTTMSALTASTFSAFDLETTHTDPQEARIVQAGVVRFAAGQVTRRTWRCHPGIPIPPEASAVHGITEADVAGRPPFSRVWDAVRRALGDGPIVTYNGGAFDLPVLAAALGRAGLPPFSPAQHLDVFSVVSWHFRAHPRRTLSAMCERFGLPLAAAHDAGADGEATGRLLMALVDKGYLPDEPEAACLLAGKLGARVAYERARYGRFFYIDRETRLFRQPDPPLRFGFGRLLGQRLEEVAPSEVAAALAGQADLPPAVEAILLRAPSWQRIAEARGREVAGLQAEVARLQAELARVQGQAQGAVHG